MHGFLKQAVKSRPDYAALLVSLYLVLLAFFIMLVAMSEFDITKQDKAVASLQDTFAISRQIQTLEYMPSPGLEVLVQELFAELRDTVALLMPLKKLEVIEHHDELMIMVPMEQLFARDSTAIQPQKQPYLRQLSELLKRWQYELMIDMDIVLGTTNIDPAPTAQDVSVGRAGEIARFFLDSGLPKSQIAVGIADSEPKMITFSFFVRGAAEPFLPHGVSGAGDGTP